MGICIIVTGYTTTKQTLQIIEYIELFYVLYVRILFCMCYLFVNKVYKKNFFKINVLLYTLM